MNKEPQRVQERGGECESVIGPCSDQAAAAPQYKMRTSPSKKNRRQKAGGKGPESWEGGGGRDNLS